MSADDGNIIFDIWSMLPGDYSVTIVVTNTTSDISVTYIFVVSVPEIPIIETEVT